VESAAKDDMDEEANDKNLFSSSLSDTGWRSIELGAVGANHERNVIDLE